MGGLLGRRLLWDGVVRIVLVGVGEERIEMVGIGEERIVVVEIGEERIVAVEIGEERIVIVGIGEEKAATGVLGRREVICVSPAHVVARVEVILADDAETTWFPPEVTVTNH